MAGGNASAMVIRTSFNEQSKIWHGAVSETRFGPQDSIGSVVLDNMRKHPDHIVQICYQSGRQLTNRELARLSMQVARHFEKLNLKQCDVVGICAANSDYVAPLLFGALFAGLSVSTADQSFNINGLKHVYAMTRPKVMFCDGDIYHRVRQAFNECGLSSVTVYTVRNHIEGVPNILEFFTDIIDEDGFRVPPLENGAEQVAMILCTSGTTAKPKGVLMSHTAILHNAVFGLKSANRILCFSSIYWFTGLTLLIRSAADHVTRIISENPFTPQDLFDIVKLYKVTVAIASPSHIPLCLASDKLVGSDLSSLKLMFATGKSVPYSLIEKFRPFAPKCRFTTYYGMTEVCGAITTAVIEPSNSVGQLKVNTEVKIIDDQGQHLGPNMTGEVCIRTKFPSSGYLNNPEATKAMYKADGWVHSGDMGYFNDDGSLYIVDRRTDILKYNNYHVSPTSIEKVIYEIPEVAEVCVVGIPDVTYDFLPAAAIVKRHGTHIQESDISQYVRDRMQHFEHLCGGVYFFSSLPQTPTGKTIRHEVAEMCKAQRNQQDPSRCQSQL